MKKILLSQGKFALIDDCDYKWLNQWNWHLCDGYACRSGKRPRRQKIWMHREILGRIGHTDFKYGDHINGDRADNRRKNLRPATARQNAQNRKSCGKTSQYKGVDFMCNRGKYRVQIEGAGVNHYLGFFNDPKDAARAYNEAALKLHGEFARLNEVD